MKMLMLLMMAAEPAASSAPDIQLLDFTATYCQPCQQMLPILKRMEADRYPIRRIDITEEHELARRFKVDLVPTMVLMVEGKEVKRFVGLTGERELRAEMRRAKDKLQEEREQLMPPESGAPPVVDPESELVRTADQSLSEKSGKSRPSVSDVFRGMFGSKATLTGLERPSVRGQSPEDAARPLTGLKAAEAATVRVRVSGTSTKDSAMLQDVGTGTIIFSATGQALILTCAHLFLDIAADSAVVDVEIFEGGKATRFPAKLVDGDHNSDLAILQIQTSRILPTVRLTPLSPRAEKGQPLVSFGCNEGADPTRLDTRLVDINRYDGPSNLMCSTDPKSGRSGGGLFTAAGELLAVCSCADRKRSEGMYMAHEAILEMIVRLKLQSILQAPAGSGEDAAVAFAELSDKDSGLGGSEADTANPVALPARRVTQLDDSAEESERSAGIETGDEFQEEAEADVLAAQEAPVSAPSLTSTRSADAQKVISGPEITILIDDKTPGSEKRVIVIPHASPWMMELLTGEMEDGTLSATAAVQRPAGGTAKKNPANRSRQERALTQVP